MFGLFRKKTATKVFNAADLKVDMHSHLLPGIDDGADSIDTSLELISGLSALGYERLITTPHIRWDIFKNTRDIILNGLETVQKELSERQLNILLHAAAEYYLDDHVMDLVRTRQPLLTLHKNVVLVEFSMMRLPFNLREMIFDLLMAGYVPVIAHPERYTYLEGEYDLFHELKDNGCKLQMNLLSAAGQYGKVVTGMTHYMLKHDLYDLAGTDLHHRGHLQRLQQLGVTPEMEQLMERSAKNDWL